MTTAINIKEAILDKTSNYNIKRFRIGNMLINYPIKSLKINDISKRTFLSYMNSSMFSDRIVLFETSRTIKEETINKILHERDKQKIAKIFDYRQWATPHLYIYTFDFNPFKTYILNNIRELEGFFSYYYSISDFALFVPNIKVKKKVPQENKYKWIMSIDEYIKYVDWCVETLNSRNNKPIFVPVSLRFSIMELSKLARHYLKKEYFNIWIDFEIGTPSPQNIARIRHFLNIFWKQNRFNDIIVYATNLKREYRTAPSEYFAPGTDPVTSIIGVNLIGVNKSPSYPGNDLIDKDLRLRHKARLFDPDTYYYVMADFIEDETLRKKIKDKEHNTIINTAYLNFELKRQALYFLENLEIRNYVGKKKMLQEYKNGELLDILFYPKTKKLTEFMEKPDKMLSDLDLFS